MRRAQVVLMAVLVLGPLLSACSSSVPDYAQVLDEGYLRPLEQRFAVQVSRTCHLADDSKSPKWQIVFRGTVNATPAEIAATLKQAGLVTRVKADAIQLQQFPGEPARGWNGQVESAEASSGAKVSSIDLTFNNADSAQRPDRLLGWRETCPPSGSDS